MNNNKRFITLKTKIMITTLIPVVMSFVIMGTAIFSSLYVTFQRAAESDFLQIGQKYAHRFESKINSAMNYLSIITSELEIRVKSGSTDRDTLQKTILNIFNDYMLLDGSSVYFESNMYDGKDAEYVGSEYGSAKSGRICWYYYKDNGETAFLPEGISDDIEFSLPFYTEAKEKNKPIYTDPVAHEIDGRSISMFTITYPIHGSNEEFIGAVTVDLFLEDIYAQLQQEKIYETGYIIISNDNEQVIYSPSYEDIGKTRKEIGIDYPLLEKGASTNFLNSKSIINGKESMVELNSIYIPLLDSSFYVSVTAPIGEINANGIRLMILLFAFGAIVVSAIALLLYYLIGKLSAPLNEITDSVNKISGGDYNARIKGDYKGEFAVVKDSVNAMADRIESYIGESKNSLEILISILNGLDAYLYVSDPNTDEILFINNNMKELFGFEDDKISSICWKIFQCDLENRCDSCPCYQLDIDPNSAVVWEEHNTINKRYYRNNDRYIDWIGGQKAHLQHSVDITDIKAAQFALDKRLKQQGLMTSISQNFLSGGDTCTLISMALKMSGEFMGAAQILCYKKEEDGITFNCENEWMNPMYGLSSRIGDKLVLKGPLLTTIQGFEDGKLNFLCSNNPQQKAAMAPYRLHFQNFITAPIFLNGELIAALDFSKEDDGSEWSESELNLVAFISSLLTGVYARYFMESDLIVAKEMAEQASKAKSEFLSRMSHEIRTPMNAIIGMTKIADASNDIEKIRYCLSTIGSSSEHLLGIINDILDMSKIEAGKFELDNEYFNIEKMLMKICNLIIDKTEQKKQMLNISIGKKMHLTYLGDELRLSQIITNLLSNAVKFTPEEGKITLTVDEIESGEDNVTLRFSITDTGIGMTSEQIKRLFNSFEQVDGSISRRYGGTGLGLVISKNIIEKMGGSIWVESEVGQGSSFIFDIKIERSNQLNSRTIFGGINASDLKLLIVDDSDDVRKQFLEIVTNFEIYSDEANSGDAAVSLIEKACTSNKPYDVIFLDSDMPDMDGIETVKKLNGTIDKNTVIIMMSFSEGSDFEEAARSIGISRFMTKILFPSSILDMINEVIGNTVKALDIKTSSPVEVINFSDISILLVEDVEINREIFIALMEDTGINIDIAENGIQAIQKFEDNANKYDMIIMDIQMPEMGGYEATRIIRSLDTAEAKNIPIIAMTANAFKEDIDKCLESGMNDHIPKPIDVDIVTKKILFYSKK